MNELFGLVIAGGKSTRMGTDKGFINYYSDSQINHVYGLLLKHCTQVFVSCNAEQKIDLPCIIDNSNINLEGPALGLMSAFNSYKNPWLVIAIDYPWINDLDVQHLIQHRDETKKASVYINGNNFFEPCFAIYETAFSLILEQITSLDYSLQRLLRASDVEVVYPLNEKTLTNVNDWETYLKIKSELK